MDVIRVGDELIFYGNLALEPPFGFVECRRGHFGTKPAAHEKGDRVVHLVRAAGTPMIDMDSTPDQYEYVLGSTIGYDSSMSFHSLIRCMATANRAVQTSLGFSG